MADKALIFTIASAIGAIGIILTFSRKIVSITAGFVRFFPDQIQAAKDCAAIRKEVTTNGGGSLKDAVMRIETRTSISEQIQRARDSDSIHGIFYAYADGKYYWGNLAYLKMVDRQFDDIIGDGWQAYIHGDDRDRVMDEWDRAVKGKREFVMEYRLTYKNTPVKVNAHKLTDPATRMLLGYSGSMHIIDPKPA